MENHKQQSNHQVMNTFIEPVIEQPPSTGRFYVTLELFENERYSPRLGFAAKGLLIADRNNISSADGSTK